MEEYKMVTFAEKQMPIEKSTAPSKPNETLIKMKRTLNRICSEMRKVLFWLEEINTSLPIQLPETFDRM